MKCDVTTPYNSVHKYVDDLTKMQGDLIFHGLEHKNGEKEEDFDADVLDDIVENFEI